MISPEEVQDWLEWSGSKLIALQLSSALPKSYKNNWPSFAIDTTVATTFSKDRLKPPTPTSKEIALMDEFLLLPGLIKDITTRRIVNARSVVAPVSQKHLFSWNKLATLLHADRRKIMALHHKGLIEITKSLAPSKVDVFRQTLEEFRAIT